MRTQDPIDKLILEQSSEWVETLRRGKREDLEPFARWLLESKRHVRHFLLMTALDEELRHLDPEKHLVVQRVQESGAEVVAFNDRADVTRGTPLHSLSGDTGNPVTSSPQAPSRYGRPLRWYSLAALIGVSFIGILMAPTSLLGGEWHEYRTAVGEQRSVVLTDGSVVQINTRSRIAVRMSEGSRDIRLPDGEAAFTVSHDPARPFRVHLNQMVVQAQGTQFNVYRRPGGSTVSALSGIVELFPARAFSFAGDRPTEGAPEPLATLVAGKQVEVDDAGKVGPQRDFDAEVVNAWKQRRLVLRDASLSQLVAEFNRYNETPRFTISGAARSKHRFWVSFDVNDSESFAQALAQQRGLEVQPVNGDYVIRQQAQVNTRALTALPSSTP